MIARHARARARAALGTFRRTCSLAVGLAAGIAGPRAAAAQITVVPPSGSAIRGDTLTTVTPTFRIQAVNVGDVRPLRFVFQIATSAQFRVPLVVDTIVQTTDSAFTFTPNRALPEPRIWWRALLLDQIGNTRYQTVGGPLIVPPWVTAVSPPLVAGQPVRTRHPRFIWRSLSVNEPPGPWEYEIRIVNLGDTVITATTRDTTFVVPARSPLQAEASYRWSITARLPGTGQVTGAFEGTAFFVEDPTVLTSTLLHSNFPNPFPTAARAATCVWFDLGSSARVELDIFDLHGLRVRRLLPNADFPGVLPAGRYGRAAAESNEGCDERFEWDGTSTDGRVVPAGVYLLRFRANGIEDVRKILFRGR